MKSYAFREALPEEILKTVTPYPELVRNLLYYRGVASPTEIEAFLNPSYDNGLHDPFLMKDMDKAVDRILKAINNDEKILIYSDYDADGIPAAVVLSDFFQAINYPNVEVYIPHRHKEGYGLNDEAIESFKGRVNLMITLDCGIVDLDEVVKAQSYGIDVIVTDHHLPGPTLPNAVAVLDPKRVDCEYPYKMLCGAGVGYKLVQGLKAKGGFTLKDGLEKWLLDMVGLATLSDMVPLTGENRIFAYYGLKVLRKSRRPGLTKLLKLLKIDQNHLSEDDIGFMITPRINAASRMGTPIDAYELLSTKEERRASELAKHLDAINQERKGLVGSLVKQIKKIMDDRADHFEDKPVIVLGNPEWRPAILGLAANSLVEEYNKPVFLWGREDGEYIKGSCRSEGETDMVALMSHARPAFLDFGGHAMSGGFSVSPEAIHNLEVALVEAHSAIRRTEKVKAPIFIDAVLELDDVNDQVYKHVEQLGPFGVDNSKPLFLFKNVVIEEVRIFGKKPEHLELTFISSGFRKVKAIGFFTLPGDFDIVPERKKTINLVATMERSVFMNRPELRLRIVDIVII